MAFFHSGRPEETPRVSSADAAASDGGWVPQRGASFPSSGAVARYSKRSDGARFRVMAWATSPRSQGVRAWRCARTSVGAGGTSPNGEPTMTRSWDASGAGTTRTTWRSRRQSSPQSPRARLSVSATWRQSWRSLREWPAGGNDSKPASRRWERPEDFLDIFFSENVRTTKGSKPKGSKTVRKASDENRTNKQPGNRYGGRTGAGRDDVSTIADLLPARWSQSR